MNTFNGLSGSSMDSTPSEEYLMYKLENEQALPPFTNEIIFENITSKTLTCFNDNYSNDNKFISKTIKISENNNNKCNHTKILGRKKKGSRETGKHNKYSPDNMIRKIKPLFQANLIDFINKKLKSNNIILTALIGNKEYRSKKFLKIKNTQNYNISTNFNLKLFNKTIKEVLSAELSDKCRNYPKTFHKIAINNLYDEKKSEDIINLLNLTYLDCFKYYRGDIDRKTEACLKGLDEYFKKIHFNLEKEGEESEYISSFIDLIKRMDSYFYEKKSRKTETSEASY